MKRKKWVLVLVLLFFGVLGHCQEGYDVFWLNEQDSLGFAYQTDSSGNVVMDERTFAYLTEYMGSLYEEATGGEAFRELVAKEEELALEMELIQQERITLQAQQYDWQKAETAYWRDKYHQLERKSTVKNWAGNVGSFGVGIGLGILIR